MTDSTTTGSERIEALTRDIILRALAALRERNALPSIDLPPVALAPLSEAPGYRTRVAREIAAAADAAEIEHRPIEALATLIANYLAEVVDLVPAYTEIARVESDDGGDILLFLRAG